MLAHGESSVVRYVMWCGVQSGRVKMLIRRPKGSAILDFGDAEATGPGAVSPLRCRDRSEGQCFAQAARTAR